VGPTSTIPNALAAIPAPPRNVGPCDLASFDSYNVSPFLDPGESYWCLTYDYDYTTDNISSLYYTYSVFRSSDNTEVMPFDQDGPWVMANRPGGWGTSLNFYGNKGCWYDPCRTYSDPRPGDSYYAVFRLASTDPVIEPVPPNTPIRTASWPSITIPGPAASAVEAAEVGLATNPRSSLNECSTGKPINCATGNFWHTFDDLAVPGRGPALNLQRTYNSFQHASDSMFGFGWSSSYGMNLTTDAGGVVTVSQENGSAIKFAPNGSGGYTAPARVLASLVKNADGTLTLTDSRGGMTHTFAAAGQLLAVKDRNGVTTTLGYDVAGQLTTVTDAAGRALTFTYLAGRVATATDPAGRKVSYSYDASGNLASATNVNGGIWAYTYDSAHQLLTMTDPRGGVVAANTYDSAGRVAAQSDALGLTTALAYSGDPASLAGSTTTITDPRGNVTKQAYVQFQMESITHAFGTPQAATTAFTYDLSTNNVASKTDPNAHTTTYTWDSQGNQTSSTGPLGRTTSTSWTALNEPASVTDPAGHSTTFGYDTRGNRVAQYRAVDATTTQSTTFTYGDAAHPGDVTSMVDPTGKT
jgi:YD repeat-containing protein